jgi:hypothetical protein
MWRGAGTAVAAALLLTGCTANHDGDPPQAVDRIVNSLFTDGVYPSAPATVSWARTTLARWARVTHASYPPGTDLSGSMLVVEVDSAGVMTCGGCIGVIGRRPTGRYVVRTSRVAGMGSDTVIGPRRGFALGRLGSVETRALPLPTSVGE